MLLVYFWQIHRNKRSALIFCRMFRKNESIWRGWVSYIDIIKVINCSFSGVRSLKKFRGQICQNLPDILLQRFDALPPTFSFYHRKLQLFKSRNYQRITSTNRQPLLKNIWSAVVFLKLGWMLHPINFASRNASFENVKTVALPKAEDFQHRSWQLKYWLLKTVKIALKDQVCLMFSLCFVYIYAILP